MYISPPTPWQLMTVNCFYYFYIDLFLIIIFYINIFVWQKTIVPYIFILNCDSAVSIGNRPPSHQQLGTWQLAEFRNIA